MRKYRRSKVKREDDLRSQIEELKRLGHLQKLRIEEEIRKSFELKQKLEALEEKNHDKSNELEINEGKKSSQS